VSRLRSVWHVAREYTGIAEAGGVKDVASGLCRALARRGIPATAVVPLYGLLPRAFELPPPSISFSVRVPDHDEGWTVREEPVSLRALVREGVRILLVESPRFADKRGVYTYTSGDERENPHKRSGTGHWDFLQMNAILAKAALLGARGLGEQPSVIHCHDGHAALLPAMMRADPGLRDDFAATGALVTIHNAGEGYHQEIWDRDFARLLTGLDVQALERATLHGMIDPFLLAAPHAVMNTVSEQYARELLQERDRERGGGLGRALREGGFALAGVTNGVDPSAYDPRSPESSGLPARFDPSRGDLEGRQLCRHALAERLAHLGNLPGPGVPVYAFIGRLAGQKGVDVLAAGVRAWLGRGGDAAFVILGEGEKWAEDSLRSIASDPASRGRVFFLRAYDAALAKLIDAASDFLLIPSVYEPCGLTDFHAQLLGCIPVVHRVGGLVKVEDGVTGFSWDEHSAGALAAALDRTAGIFRRDRALLDRIRKQGFERVLSRYTWERVLEEGYMPLYESALTGEECRRG
jgi:starch synthase